MYFIFNFLVLLFSYNLYANDTGKSLATIPAKVQFYAIEGGESDITVINEFGERVDIYNAQFEIIDYANVTAFVDNNKTIPRLTSDFFDVLSPLPNYLAKNKFITRNAKDDLEDRTAILHNFNCNSKKKSCSFINAKTSSAKITIPSGDSKKIIDFFNKNNIPETNEGEFKYDKVYCLVSTTKTIKKPCSGSCGTLSKAKRNVTDLTCTFVNENVALAYDDEIEIIQGLPLVCKSDAKNTAINLAELEFNKRGITLSKSQLKKSMDIRTVDFADSSEKNASYSEYYAFTFTNNDEIIFISTIYKIKNRKCILINN